jgi:hypothetical protein
MAGQAEPGLTQQVFGIGGFLPMKKRFFGRMGECRADAGQ